MKSVLLLAFALVIAWAAIGLQTEPAASYPSYNGSPACDDCHSGFNGFGAALHDLHNEMTSSCSNCHESVGDNPEMEKCAGCHVSGDDGGGLVLHHTNAEAPADANGMRCATCHPGASADTEDVAPPYYGLTSVSLSDPCETDTEAGGEDYDGDGKGLDNDGDLAYDADDDDCTTTPAQRSTWGSIKVLYE